MTESDSHKHSADWADQAGIWCSILCLIHCALTPVVLLFMPALVWGGDGTHALLATVLPLIAIAAFVPGFRQHRDWTILATGAMGLLFIVFALWAPKPYVEMAMTMAGSLLLIRAHWRNRQLQVKCAHGKCQKTQPPAPRALPLS